MIHEDIQDLKTKYLKKNIRISSTTSFYLKTQKIPLKHSKLEPVFTSLGVPVNFVLENFKN